MASRKGLLVGVTLGPPGIARALAGRLEPSRMLRGALRAPALGWSRLCIAALALGALRPIGGLCRRHAGPFWDVWSPRGPRGALPHASGQGSLDWAHLNIDFPNGARQRHSIARGASASAPKQCVYFRLRGGLFASFLRLVLRNSSRSPCHDRASSLASASSNHRIVSTMIAISWQAASLPWAKTV